MKKKIVREFIQKVWNEGDIEAISDFIGLEYTIHHDPDDPWEGMTLDMQAFKDRVSKSRAPFPDQRFDVQEIFENEHGVAITWLWSGTHSEDFADFPASGKQIKMSGATVYYFEDNQITGHWQITDRLSVFRQLQQASAKPDKK
jgi:steroid delta-isomerase-like uncharacterized protein